MERISMPSYIKVNRDINEPVKFNWSDKVWDDLLIPNPEMEKQLAPISYRGILALVLGSAEWVIWRINKYLLDSIPFQVIEAAWAGIIDWRYIKSFEVPDWSEQEEKIPYHIGSCLDFTFWQVKEAFILARRNQPFWECCVSISNLAIYILDDVQIFKNWQQLAIERLTNLHSKKNENRLGSPVAKEILNSNNNYQFNSEKVLLGNFLYSLNYKQNPYLRSPEELIAAGFSSEPYYYDKQ